MINWKVRIKNKNFWLGFIPSALLLAQTILGMAGITVDFGALNEKLLAVINAVFVILAMLGIVTDPTTAGIGDSALAMTYEIPKTKDGIITADEKVEE